MSFPPPPNPHVRPSTAPSDRGPPAAIYVRPASSPPLARGRGRSWGLRVGLVAALLLTVGGAGAGLKAHYLPRGYVVPGIVIDGERVPDGADAAQVHALVEGRAAALAAHKVELAMPGADQPVLTTTLGELGLHVDVDETVAVATRVGKDADPWTRA